MNSNQRMLLMLSAGYGAGLVSERLYKTREWTRGDVISVVLLASMAIGCLMAALLWP
jgi:hypothetical protein